MIWKNYAYTAFRTPPPPKKKKKKKKKKSIYFAREMTTCMHYMHPPKLYKLDEGIVIIFVSGKNWPLFLLYISGKIKKKYHILTHPYFSFNWGKCIILTPPPCFAVCSVSGHRVVLRIPIPTPPDVNLPSSMTNQLYVCPHVFVSNSYSFFKTNCDLQSADCVLSMWRKIMIPMVQCLWVYTDDTCIYLDVWKRPLK